MATPPAVVTLSIEPADHDNHERPVRLEPVMGVEISVPRECVDGVSFTLMGRRARVEAEEVHGTTHIVHVEIPMADMIGFASELRVRTQGRASFSTRLLRYQPVPRTHE